MDFEYSDDQKSIQELARKILQELATHDRLTEVGRTETRLDAELWRALAEANLLGVAVPEEHGGMGMGVSELCIVFEEIGRSVAPIAAFPTLVLGALPIAAFGSDEQKATWLPAVAAGDAILSAAVVEEAGAVVRASHDGTSWRLDGHRVLVQAAHVARRVLVPARDADGALGLFLVDPGAEGVSLESVETTDQHLRPNLAFESVRIPEAEVLAAPGDGEAPWAWLMQQATLVLCAIQLGVADRSLEITASYTSERKQFDRPVGSFQAVHTRAGDAYVDTQAMRLTLLRALHIAEHGGDDLDMALAIAKFWASEGGDRVTYAAQHLHGGIGVDIEYPIHRYYLWARQIGMHLGSAPEQLARIGETFAA